MAMKRALMTAVVAATVSACGPWPKVDAPLRTHEGAWPALLPIDQVTGLPTDTFSGQSDAQRLASRAASLRARAQIMREAVPDQDAFDALRARLAR